MLKTNQILQEKMPNKELKRKETILRTEIILLENLLRKELIRKATLKVELTLLEKVHQKELKIKGNSQNRANSSRESAPERTQNQRNSQKVLHSDRIRPK
jgi:hypothetical protein